MPDNGLSLAKLSSIIFLIATGGKDQIAADMAGVTIGTLKGWQQEPEYKAEYSKRASQFLGLDQQWLIKVNRQIVLTLYRELLSRLDEKTIRDITTKELVSIIKTLVSEVRMSLGALNPVPAYGFGNKIPGVEEDQDEGKEGDVIKRFRERQGRQA